MWLFSNEVTYARQVLFEDLNIENKFSWSLLFVTQIYTSGKIMVCGR